VFDCVDPAPVSRLPVVFLFESTLLPVRSEDHQRIAQHFLLESPTVQVDARLAPALWLAFFKLRNACRANRLSLYWQRELEARYGVHSFGDYLSVARGGETRGQILRRQQEYFIKSCDEIKELVEPVPPPPLEFKYEEKTETKPDPIPVHVKVVNELASEAAILDVLYKERSPVSGTPLTILLILSDSAEIFENWRGVERVMVTAKEEPARLRARIHQFLRFHLACFSRVATPGLSNLDAVRSKILKPTTRKGGGAHLYTSLSAFREAVEVGDFCDGGGVHNTQIFGWDLFLDHSALPPHSAVERVVLPDQPRYAEPISILGSNEAFRHAASESKGAVSVVAIPNLLDPAEYIKAFEEERPPVHKIFQRQFDALQSVVEGKALSSYQLRTHGSFQFNHFYAVLPLVRSSELQALLAHITTAMRTQHTYSAFLRFQCGGKVSDARVAAWAFGLYHRRLALGGVGTEVAEFWVDPKIELVGDTPDEIATKYAKGELRGHLAHPLERHARLRKLLREGVEGTMSFSANLYGYLSALSAYLR
jgi:hypothetical protein